ncbi:DNA polymerase Y family protein [Clostridium paraputrificum]|uniref:DNA polymerase Y family protein n=1 Tax=Clostridium paraputrificum TaxID=29363 RepID=UPI003D3412FF
MREKLIFHIDVNSAYLSWTAVSLLQQGAKEDIREIPSIIGGNSEERHGIVLAKSIPAKKYKIQTGEPIISALTKCPKLKIFKPNYKLYMKCSNAMYNLISEYSPLIQRYSIDEVFVDVTHFKDNYLEKAYEIKDRIKKDLGFIVNIGISTNKLLAKMASDLPKKDFVHTLFPEEMKTKMLPLPVADLFMVGRATQEKLDKLNVQTIGDLAKYDTTILKTVFKSFGTVIHNYANGIDNSIVRKSNYVEVKGLGNSTTVAWDITSREEALKILLSLLETTASRLRENQSLCGVIVVSIKDTNFMRYTHQKHLPNYCDSTEELFKYITAAFDESWKGEPIRQLGVRLTKLCSNEFFQSSLFDSNRLEKQRSLDRTIDTLRNKYGSKYIIRSTFLHSYINPLCGGVGEDDYPMMGSIL